MGQPLTRNFPWQSTDKVGGFEMRRIVDILVSFTILVLNSPIILLLMVAIKLESPGPALVRERRIGQRRKGGSPTSPGPIRRFRDRGAFA
jgi:lipopolysaccharide/colanic/teichoic acid biosynthesis glycosyltransferase